MFESTTLDLLKATRAKIAQGWTQGAAARNANGVTVESLAPEACAWCVYGAAIASGASLWARLEAYRVLERFTNGVRADAFNDDVITSQAEALAWLDLAIAAASTEAEAT